MLWRACAYGLVSSLSRQDPSWPTHRHLWPRRSYRAVTLLHPFNFTSPITPVPIISHTGMDFCHLLPPALKTPMASSQLLYGYTAEGGLLLTQKLQSSSRLANPASFSALWGLIHIFKEVWALWESIHPWLLSFCPRTLCSVSLHVILTYLSQLIILDIILNINNSLCYIKLPI